MGDMSMGTMGGAGGGPAPGQFRFKASTAGPYSTKEEDTRHPKMLSPESSRLPKCYPGESSELRLARTEGRLMCLNIIDECTGEAVEEAAKGCIQQVSDFFAGWRFRDWDGVGGGTAKDGMRSGMGESDLVPLAIVDAGLQQCDRSSAVEHIKRGLERGPCRSGAAPSASSSARRPQVVAVLRGHDCVTIQAALTQITRQCVIKGGTRSRRPLFMDALEEWYNSCPYPSDSAHLEAGVEEEEEEEETEGVGAGRRLKAVKAAAAARRRRGPVVVLLEDVEGFDKQVLRDLMNVLAQPPCKMKGLAGQQQRGAAAAAAKADTRHGRPVPIAVVAIASTRVGFPMDRLAPSAVRQLYTEHFHFPSSLECVEVLYDKLFIQGRLPFWMGGRLLSWMKTTFNDTHLSVGTLSKQVKMEASFHFSRPASYLCLHHCRPWLRSSLVGNCPEDTMNHFKYKLVRDSRMSSDRLRAALPGVPPDLGPDQAVGLIEQGLRREAARAMRLWFFHKVWKVLLKSLGERETTLGELKLADTILGGPHASAGVTGPHAEFRGSHSSKRIAELGSPMRIVGLLSLSLSLLSKKSKRLFTELTEVSQGLAHLVPGEVEGLLRGLIAALPSASASSSVSASANQNARPPAAPTNRSQEPTEAEASGGETETALPAVQNNDNLDNLDNLGDVDSASRSAAPAQAGAGAGAGAGAEVGVEAGAGAEAGLAVRSIHGGGDGGGTAGSAGLTHSDSDSDTDIDMDNDGAIGAGITRPSEPPAQAQGRVSGGPEPPAQAQGRVSGGPGEAVAPSPAPTTASKSTSTSASAKTRPWSIQGLDSKEASYLRRGAERVLKLWLKAHQEGWAEPDNNTIQWSLASSHLSYGGGAAAAAGSSGGSRGGGGKSTGSRGNRLFNSALYQSSTSASPRRNSNSNSNSNSSSSSQQQHRQMASVAAQQRGAGAAEHATGRPNSPLSPRLPGDGGSGSSEALGGKREQALRRACLVKELQLLFLHVMGAARGESLGPGMEHPPPLTEYTSVLAEVYCCDDRDREALEASLCPLTRTSVDVGMMEGACKGTSSVVQKRKEMSEEQPVLDICLLYSCYRGHGKTIDRSDWFTDFRKETLKHKKNHSKSKSKQANTEAKALKGTNGSNKAGRSKSPGGGGAPDDGSSVDPTGSAELLARFEHASDQLASMGYVRPLKRRKKLEERRRGEAPGPMGAVTRLVFSYTMEDGAL